MTNLKYLIHLCRLFEEPENAKSFKRAFLEFNRTGERSVMLRCCRNNYLYSSFTEPENKGKLACDGVTCVFCIATIKGILSIIYKDML